MASKPLAQGNRLQRWYAAWAAPYYARMPEHLRAEAERIDQWLYGPGGAGLALGLAGAVGGTTAGLMAARLPWGLALGLSVVAWVCLLLSLLAAWLQPEKFSARKLLRASLKIVVLGYLGALAGYLFGRFMRRGDLGTETLAQALRGAAVEATPLLLALMLAVLLAVWGVAQVKRVQVQRELSQLRLVQERDSAARQAAESRLHLLQAQIQPHFLFNTLAALQHWVDAGDARAGPLLRDLTGFLRGSTALLGQAEATLADEAEAARQYLRILQARLGARLQFSIEIDPASAARTLPAGILLTLVENAVEHGISPALHGGTVQVRARSQGQALVLEVLDDGAGLASPLSEGLGLSNCRQRLLHRYGTQATLSLLTVEGGTCARVELHSA